MQNIVNKEWKAYKKEIEASIKETIEKDTADKEVLELMLELLKSSKLKKRTTETP